MIWMLIGLCTGLILFAAGFGWGSVWQQRRELTSRFATTPARWPEAVDYAEDEPREPGPFTALWGA